MKRRHIVLALLFLLSIITFVDRVCISVAGPRMQEELGITPAMWGWVTGVFTISYAIFEIPCGALADRIGARAVLTRIVLWWSAFTSVTGLVSNFYVLLLVRFCFGAGEAGAYPGSASVISRWFPPTERARATGAVWMASRLGGALSPLLVVPIQQAYGWRMSFYVFGLLGVAWCIVWYGWYRNSPAQHRGVTRRELDEIGTGPARIHHGLPWRVALRNGNFWIILLMYHLYCWGGYFYLSWLPTYLQRGRGFTEDEMKIWTMLPFLFGACGNLVGGLLSDFLVRRKGLKFGRRILGTAGLGLSGVFMFLTSQTDNKLLAVLFLSLGYASMDCMLPVSWAVCLDIGGTYAGAVSGCMNMAGQAGSFLTSVTFGYIVTATGNYNLPLASMAVFLWLAAVLFTRIDPTRPLIPVPADRGPTGNTLASAAG
jgi:MFS family permease